MNAETFPVGMTPVETGEFEGVRWATCRAPLFGAVNGYALLPDGHPWRGIANESDIPADVHGGLTYSRNGWIGFDFLHYGDWWPEQGDAQRWGADEDRECTPDDVKVEAIGLARQIHEASS